MEQSNVNFGFYDSQSGDRTYNSDDFSRLFDGLINDGVYAAYGKAFQVTPTDPFGMNVIVKSGRAWFNHKWVYSDQEITVPINSIQGSSIYSRIDAVVIDIDTNNRLNKIKVVAGQEAPTPTKPELINSSGHYQHPLAYITVHANRGTIEFDDIEITVGKSECPFVTGIVETISIDELLENWSNDFHNWFDNLQIQLEGDVATHLQNQINDLDDQIGDLDELILIPEASRSSVSSAAKYLSEQVCPEDGPFLASKDSGPAEFIRSASVALGPNVATLEIQFRISGAQPAGTTLMTGHIHERRYYPSCPAYGISYYGNSIQVMYITPDGQFTIKNLVTAMPSGTLTSNITATYLCVV